MIKKSFLAIFMRVKYEFLEALQVKTQKKGPLRDPVIAYGSVTWDENRRNYPTVEATASD